MASILVVVIIIFWVWVNSPMIVTVTGTGDVSVPATAATVSFSISENNAQADAAIAAVNAKALAVRGILKASGVVDADIVESQVTTYPASAITAGATGYQATLSVAAKTTKVGNVNSLVASLYANGVTLVSQPVVSVDNQSELEAKAINTAMLDAKDQANKIALSNWKLIRKIVAIDQQSSGNTATATSNTGTFKITESVSVSYKMW